VVRTGDKFIRAGCIRKRPSGSRTSYVLPGAGTGAGQNGAGLAIATVPNQVLQLPPAPDSIWSPRLPARRLYFMGKLRRQRELCWDALIRRRHSRRQFRDEVISDKILLANAKAALVLEMIFGSRAGIRGITF